MLSFYQITDIHYYAVEALHPTGEAWEKRAKYDQKCVAESGAIFDAAIDHLLADRQTDIVLVSGDLVSDGEREGHFLMREKLRRMAEGGKRVFALTATHDVCTYPKQYSQEKGEHPAEGISRDELLELYWEFGPAQALSVHKASFSYVVQLAPGYRLLALNADGNGWESDFYGYDEAQLAWIRQALQEGRDSGDVLLVMGHNPVLPPSPIYPLFSPHEMLANHEQIAEMFADAGVQFLFTGHTHMQNIASFDSPKGNRLYEINTASLIGYPSPIRHMTLTDEAMTVRTEHIETAAFDMGGKTYMEFSKAHFEFMLRDIFHSAAWDIHHFCEISQSFSLPPEKAWKLRVPIGIAGKAFDRMTFQKAGRWLCCSSAIAPEMRNVRLQDFLLEVLCNLYGGDEPYAPDTPEYRSFMALYRRLRPVLRRVKSLRAHIDEIVEGLLYNSGFPDNDAVLPVQKFQA